MKVNKCCVVSKALMNTCIGTFEIICCANGLHRVELLSKDCKRHECNDAMFEYGIKCMQWLRVYFEDCKRVNDMEIPQICEFDRSECFLKIWKELSKTKVGETLSYADLSERVFGHRNGSRIVGVAMRRNSYSIVVPCHRVIKSNGDYGNYCGGTRNDLKKYLIEYEKQQL